MVHHSLRDDEHLSYPRCRRLQPLRPIFLVRSLFRLDLKGLDQRAIMLVVVLCFMSTAFTNNKEHGINGEPVI